LFPHPKTDLKKAGFKELKGCSTRGERSSWVNL